MYQLTEAHNKMQKQKNHCASKVRNMAYTTGQAKQNKTQKILHPEINQNNNRFTPDWLRLPRWSSAYEPTLQCRGCELNPWPGNSHPTCLGATKTTDHNERSHNADLVLQLKPCCCCIASVMSDSVRPHRRQITRLRHPWDSPTANPNTTKWINKEL